MEEHLTDPVKTYLILHSEVVRPTNPLCPDNHLLQDNLSHHRPSEPVALSDIELAGGLFITDTESSEERKNSNTSIKTVQSTPKYTECMGADKPFANISNRRMVDNITRAVSQTNTRWSGALIKGLVTGPKT